MVNTSDKLNRLVNGLDYLITAHHYKGHGIHSPAIYEFVSRVLCDKTYFNEFYNIEKQINKLKNNGSYVEIAEYGAGSGVFTSNRRKIKDIARHAGTHSKFGRLLFRMARYYKPSVIVEFGTSLGQSTFYLAAGAGKDTIIHTVEANKSLTDIAVSNAQELLLDTINFYSDTFDDVLPQLENFLYNNAIIFIDGNHTFEATIKYFNFFNSRLKQGFIIIDDIYWSRRMDDAWKQIKILSDVTIDLFTAGIIVKGEMLTPNHYKIRF